MIIYIGSIGKRSKILLFSFLRPHIRLIFFCYSKILNESYPQWTLLQFELLANLKYRFLMNTNGKQCKNVKIEFNKIVTYI